MVYTAMKNQRRKRSAPITADAKVKIVPANRRIESGMVVAQASLKTFLNLAPFLLPIPVIMAAIANLHTTMISVVRRP